MAASSVYFNDRRNVAHWGTKRTFAGGQHRVVDCKWYNPSVAGFARTLEHVMPNDPLPFESWEGNCFVVRVNRTSIGMTVRPQYKS